MARRTPSETAAVEQHLLYEIEMVVGLAERLVRLKILFDALDDAAKEAVKNDPWRREVLDVAGRNADVEAFAMHMRVLTDFFYGRRSSDDAIAADFFEHDSDWYAIRPKKPASLRRVNSRVGAEIAHLSYGRSAPAMRWFYGGLLNDLLDVALIFAKSATCDRLSGRSLK